MATANRTAYAILGLLTVEPMSGYDIKKAVEGSIENFWSESYGQIYPMLRRLAAEGSIKQSTAHAKGKRPRHLYAITQRGRDVLHAWLREPTEPPPVRIEILLKLFFGGHVDHETNHRQIEDYREHVTADLERYRAIEEMLGREHAGHPDLPYWLMTLRFGIRTRAAEIQWCDEAVAILESIPNNRRAGGRAPLTLVPLSASASSRARP